jgi:ABC-type amino acid transport substrate-binding protein
MIEIPTTGSKIFRITLILFFVILFFGETVFGHDLKLSKKELKLTMKEKAWLNSTRSLKIAGPRAFPPFHYYDEQKNLKGISADYIFSIMNELGINLDVQKDIPWTEVLYQIKSGKIDLIPCIAKTADRDTFLNFSVPYLSFPLVILTRKDAPFTSGIEDLHGKKLAIVTKNATYAWLLRDKIEFEPYFVESPLKTIEAVSYEKADAAIENLAAASYIIQEYGLTNVKVAAPTHYGNYNLHMAVRKDLPELSGIINKIINQIPPEQHAQIKNKWLRVRYEHGVRNIDILKWVLVIILIASIIFVLILRWNRKLKKEIAARMKVIDELNQAMDEIKTLKGIVPICSSCKKIRDDKGYWNRLEAFIEKHSEASFSHGICPDCSEKLYGNETWYIKGIQEKGDQE